MPRGAPLAMLTVKLRLELGRTQYHTGAMRRYTRCQARTKPCTVVAAARHNNTFVGNIVLEGARELRNTIPRRTYIYIYLI